MKRFISVTVLFLLCLCAFIAQAQTTDNTTTSRRAEAVAANRGRVPEAWPNEEIVEFSEEQYDKIIAANGREHPDLTQLGGVQSIDWLMEDPQDPDNAKLVATGAHRWAHVVYIPSPFMSQMRGMGYRGFAARRTSPNNVRPLELSGTSNDTVPAAATALTNDPLVGKQFYLGSVNVQAFWNEGITSPKDVDIFITDSNADGGHKDLSWKAGKNFVDKTDPLIATFYHATHVAGEICGLRNNGLDIAGMADCSPTLYEVVQTYFTGTNKSNPQTLVSDDAVLKAFLLIAKATKFTTVNCSWGGFSPMPFVEDIFDASEDHVKWNFAAGNQAASGSHYPARYAETHKNVLCITATDQAGLPAWYSNQALGISKSIAAPGTGNLSTEPGGTGSGQGTSYATPLVTAADALAAQMMINLGVKPEDIRPEQIRNFELNVPADKKLLNSDGTSVFGNPRSLDCAKVVENIKAAYPAAKPSAPAKPTIKSFSADKAEVKKGEIVALSWVVSDATSIQVIPEPEPASISANAGNVLPASGDMTVKPETTTAYTLSASNGKEIVTQCITVTVIAPPPPEAPAPPALLVHQDGTAVSEASPAVADEVLYLFTKAAIGPTAAWLYFGGEGIWWEISTGEMSASADYPAWKILPVQLAGKNAPLPALQTGDYYFMVKTGDVYSDPIKVVVK